MAKFDFVEAAASGYRYVWKERQSILPFATIPLLVKIGCYALVALLGLETNFLRQGLILMPGYFMEGFVVALVIRMSVFGENYNDLFDVANARQTVPEHVSRGVMGCVVIYALTKLGSSFFTGIVMNAQEINEMPVMPEPTQSPFVMSLMILIFIVWAFRFFWLYVPPAIGIRVSDFLDAIKSFTTSFYLIGFWLICTIPFLILLVSIAKMVGMIIPDGGDRSLIGIMIMGVIHSIVELIIALISGVGMAHAIQVIMGDNKKPPRIF